MRSLGLGSVRLARASFVLLSIGLVPSAALSAVPPDGWSPPEEDVVTSDFDVKAWDDVATDLIGACCLANGCVAVTVDECFAQSGAFFGGGSRCDVGLCGIGPACGNGQLEPGEQCDDGGLDAGDGCSPFCQLEAVCGNGFIEPGEQCDGGEWCRLDCTWLFPICGDGIMEGWEACDDGNPDPNDGCWACQLEPPDACGDGVLDPGEECDDGGIDAGDGCDAECRYETRCGDGQLDPSEQCDDGGTESLDGCSAACTLEAVCGNGVLEAGEACEPVDDGDETCTTGCTLVVCPPAKCQAWDTTCEIGVCDPITGECASAPRAMADCSDDDPCTMDFCDLGACVHWKADACCGVVCDDQNVCTTDLCDPASGACTTTVVPCDDGDGCTTDTCDPVSGCTSERVVCDDGDACTTEQCDPASGTCAYQPQLCDDGSSCTIDACDPATGCTHQSLWCDDGDPCTTDTCADPSGCYYEPLYCPDDGNACSTESCQAGECVSAPIECQDGDACTFDTCEPWSGCVYPLTLCDDDDACTVDACDRDLGCKYVDLPCDDQNACTIDACHEDLGCVYSLVDCDDGDRCTDELCSPGAGCLYSPHDCADGDACTTDRCSPGAGCLYDPTDCDDQNACTLDRCSPGAGCIHDLLFCDDEDPCTKDSCEPATGCAHEKDEEACKADIDIDSDNDGGAAGAPKRDAAEDAIEVAAPGRYVALNDDDDDGDGKKDLSTEPLRKAEDDTAPTVLESIPACAIPGKWRVTYSDRGELYLPVNGLLKSGEWQACGTEVNPATAQLEGVKPSAAPGDLSLVYEVDFQGDGTADAKDEVVATVLLVDLDVDSDNDAKAGTDAAPSRSDAEDLIEADDKKPGRWVPANHDDDDEDEVPDFVDGFDLDGKAGTPDDDNTKEGDLIAAVLELGKGVDLQKAVVKFAYAASPPASVTFTGAPPEPKAAEGTLRIWTKKVGRKKQNVGAGGDFVPAAALKAKDLFGTDFTKTLYLEGIAASAGIGKDTITVTLDPDGDGPAPFKALDLVRVTVVAVELTDTPEAFLPKPDGTVEHTAKILPAGVTGTFKFELAKVSTFPGECMNAGAQTDKDKDLKLVQAKNPRLTVAADGQSGTAKAKAATAPVTTTAFDYGARGLISATVTEFGATSKRRRIPKDTDQDWLPDVWEATQKDFKKDKKDSDGDGTPDGEEDDDPKRAVVANAGPNNHAAAQSALGLVGDGLVAFEEYRGFKLDDKHTRLMLEDKDVFVHTEANVALGGTQVKLGYFANLTGFAVHYIRATEWDGAAQRTVNAKRTGIPAATLQRALHVKRNDALGLFGIANTINPNVFNQSPNESSGIDVDVDDHDRLASGDDVIVGEKMTTGPNGIAETHASASDVQVIAVGRGEAGSLCVNGNGDGVHAATVLAGDDVRVGAAGADNVTSGPNGICETARRFGTNDLQTLRVGFGRPGRDAITPGADAKLQSINGSAAGPDAALCTADDVRVALTEAQKLDALRESVGHECGHGVHVEHNFCFGEISVIPIGQGLPRAAAIDAGPDGICNTPRGGDDVALIAVGKSRPDQTCIDGGADKLAEGYVLVGDDKRLGDATISTGPDGVCNTAKRGNDAQTLPVGKGTPNVLCLDNGIDGVTDSLNAGDDVERIPLGQGSPNSTCIRDDGDGSLFGQLRGDDVYVPGPPPSVDSGPNGICQSRSQNNPAGGVGIMTSNVLVPVPSVFRGADLDQVRIHQKHP